MTNSSVTGYMLATRGPDAVYDDRNKVVAMWREEGIQCFQVALGDF